MDQKRIEWMCRAITLSRQNVEQGGGPFGAVIVRGEEVIATGVNRVTASSDPTAHAEVNAIRQACRVLGTFNLSGCELYTSCEPCPMCLGAIYWAHLDRVYYANTKEDARVAQFDDSFIYEQIAQRPDLRAIPFTPLLRDEAFEVFRQWDLKTDKVQY